MRRTLAFTQRNGIRDCAVADEGDPKQGTRTPIEIVMEHVFGVSAADLVVRERTDEYEQAAEWLSERLGWLCAKMRQPTEAAAVQRGKRKPCV